MGKYFRFLALPALLIVLQSPVLASETYSQFPSRIFAEQSYVFYSHGLIVEGDNPTPRHKKWGIYKFPSIKNALSEGSTFNLIAHQRPAGTDPESYAAVLASWVNQLISAGVQPENITLIGFSRGGEITALAASALKPLPINTVLLATCWKNGVQDRPSITLSGRFLSIYETTDAAHSCEELAERSEALSSFEEIAISTGKEHGAFYTPLPEWTGPLRIWVANDQESSTLP